MKDTTTYLIGLTGNIACGKSTVLAMLRDLGAVTIDADRVTHELQQPGQPVYAQIVAAFGPGILAEPDGPIDRRKLGAIVFADPAALQRLEQIVHPAVHARIESWLESVGVRGQGPGIRDQGSGIGRAESGDSRQETADRRQQTGDNRQESGERRQQTGDSRQETTDSSSFILHPSSFRVAVIDAIKLIEAGWKPLCDAIWVVTCQPEQQLARLIATRGLSDEEARRRIAAQPAQADKVAHAEVVIDNSDSLDATRRQVEAAWQEIGDRR